jgi:hypothetical protein
METPRRHRYKVVNSTPDMADHLEALQRACFPTLADDQLIRAEQYLAHIEKFPEGQHAVIDDNGIVVASSSDLRMNIDLADRAAFQHHHLEMSGNNWMTTHDPRGEWLYGFDIGVHPRHRGARLSSRLYKARHKLVRRLNLRGHIAGGNLRGFGRHKKKMDVATYVSKVIAGELRDLALSAQLRRGFEVIGIIDNFLDDSVCDNKAAFIVWRNPDYRP